MVELSLCIREVWVRNMLCHYHDKTHADITTTKRTSTDVNVTRLSFSTMITEVPCQISLDLKPFTADVSIGVKNFMKRR